MHMEKSVDPTLNSRLILGESKNSSILSKMIKLMVNYTYPCCNKYVESLLQLTMDQQYYSSSWEDGSKKSAHAYIDQMNTQKTDEHSKKSSDYNREDLRRGTCGM
jgi:hypothetical protein